MSKVDELLASEGAAAEAYELSDEQPERVRLERPNMSRSVVLSVRFSGDEHDEIQRAAASANLPVSTVVRLWALDRLHGDRTVRTVADRLARLEEAVFRRTA